MTELLVAKGWTEKLVKLVRDDLKDIRAEVRSFSGSDPLDLGESTQIVEQEDYSGRPEFVVTWFGKIPLGSSYDQGRIFIGRDLRKTLPLYGAGGGDTLTITYTVHVS